MVKKNNPIRIGKNKDPYEMPLSLFQMATYLEYFPSNSKRELKHIYGLLALDPPTRRLNDNTIKFKTDVKERMQLQIINKALTMELLSSGMFGYIDHPAEVHANCLVSRYQPKDAVDEEHYLAVPSNFAQGGVPDVQIDYENYAVILEVSAKYQPSLQDYKKQLNGALKHARSLRETIPEKPIYCFVINERSLSLVENKEEMIKVLKDIHSSEKIYIIALSIEEFAALGKVMARMSEDLISKITSDDLHEVLQAAVEKGAYGNFREILEKRLYKTQSDSPWFI